MNGYYIAAALITPLAMLLEHLLARRAKLAVYGLADTLTNIANFTGELVLTALLSLNVFAAYAFIVDRVALLHPDPASPLVWAGAFLVLDLVYYVGHRVCHRIAVMWALHAVHHQSGDYNLGVGMRGPWLSALQIAPFIAPVALLGFPVSVLFPLYAFQTVYKLAIHTRLVRGFGPLGRVLVTPASHRLHHARNPEYEDKNFGGVLSIWDRMFGTHAEETVPVRQTRDALHGSFDAIENNVGPFRDLAAHAARVGVLRALFGRPVTPTVPRGEPMPRSLSRAEKALFSTLTFVASAIAMALLARSGLSFGVRCAAGALVFGILAFVGRALSAARPTGAMYRSGDAA